MHKIIFEFGLKLECERKWTKSIGIRFKDFVLLSIEQQLLEMKSFEWQSKKAIQSQIDQNRNVYKDSIGKNIH